ncbi:glycosyltransferase [Brevundimonas sp.]|uniref:glycosyltransferase n=1 Tax=Brevundimonas sp. TaxID=1871086 RepID=UPI0025E3A649|nr:glycosyltransferase [Brevundimonas sp.]
MSNPSTRETGDRRWPGLPVADSQRLRVCIASPDFNGPVRNGGIGTACRALAESLAAAGHSVTALYALGEWCEQGTINRWITDYAEAEIKLVPCPAPPAPIVEAPQVAQIAWRVYRWLAGQSFDIVYFPEWSGCGYYAIQAKRMGLAFGETRLVVVTHSPTLWHLEGDQQLLTYRYFLLNDDMERACVEHADAVISPSRYMLEWMTRQGWTLPAQTFVQPNLSPKHTRGEPPSGEVQPIEELVFFGRLEPRKGIKIFAAALDRLFADGLRPKVTFLGKTSSREGFDSYAFIKTRAKKWNVKPQVITDLDAEGAVNYLAQPGRLAVIASLIDNAPYTIQECLERGVPFVASRVGGIPEMVAAADADRVLFDPNPPDMVRALKRVLGEGAAAARPSVDPEANARAWAGFAPSDAPRAPVRPVRHLGPSVTVCLVHHERPDMLLQAIEGLEAQTTEDFEVVLVDDGSSPATVERLKALEPRFAARSWRIVYQDNRYLGAARNRAAAEAKGQWLLFHDDDNIARPEMIETFLRVARHSGADIVTAAMGTFSGKAPKPADAPDAIWLPIGAARAFGAIENAFGDANALVRRDAFARLGGFTEDYGVGHEDWELFARAVLGGLTLLSVPEPLFHYRVASSSMLRAEKNPANFLRNLRPYLEDAGHPHANLLRLFQGLAVEYEDIQRQAAAYEAERRKLQTTLAATTELLSDGGLRDDEALDRVRQMLNLVGGERRTGRVSASQLAELSHALFYSPPMRWTRPIRNLLNRWRGRSLEPTVLPAMSEAEQLEFVLRTITSITWEATGPLRAIARLFGYRDPTRVARAAVMVSEEP